MTLLERNVIKIGMAMRAKSRADLTATNGAADIQTSPLRRCRCLPATAHTTVHLKSRAALLSRPALFGEPKWSAAAGNPAVVLVLTTIRLVSGRDGDRLASSRLAHGGLVADEYWRRSRRSIRAPIDDVCG